MNSTETPIPAPTIARELQQAVALQQSGDLQGAEKVYRTLLQAEPAHPEANHNLGVLLVQMEQPAAGLEHLLAALEADPTRGQYWLSYIEALYQAGQLDDARQVLDVARQQGLQGDEAEAMARLVEGGAQGAGQDENAQRPADSSEEFSGTEPSPQEIDALVALFNQGRFPQAATRAQKLTARFPDHWIGWKMLGVVFSQMGQSAEALRPMQKTVELLPNDAEAHNNLGIVLQDLGRPDEAEASYRRALLINPEYAQAHSNLGSVLQKAERLDEAEASYRRALQLNPGYAKAHNNLGSVLRDMGRLDEAEASYRRALQIRPDYAEALNNLGLTLKDLERLDEAEASYLQALQFKPDYAEANYNLGAALKDMGRLEEAEAKCRSALQLKPDYAEAHGMLGLILYKLGHPDLAEASYRHALQINPDSANILNNLGIIQNDLCRLGEAEASYRRALEILPDYATAHCNLGGVLHDLGRLEEAEECWRQALKYKPDLAEAHSNLLFCLAQVGAMDAQALFAEHCRFGDQFEAPFRANFLQHGNSRDPARCLQVGIVSGDFRNHAMAYFIELVMSHLSAFPQLSLHAYSNHAIQDNVTQRLRGYFAHWHQIDSLTDAALADKIRADGIDILIDLSGHTARNRLLTFARKPAPIQISWMGYPGTTGLRAMDYFLADRFLLPPGRFEDQFTEKIVRLPATGPFLPYKDAPPVSPLPALKNGHLTFGSFNRLSKLSCEVIALWSQLLRALPDSRLLLGGMPEAGKYDTLLDWFAQESIARERLDFHPRSDMPGYLRLHQQVDICLDTFPYNGGTTTFHAIWMGVPTLSLSGKTAAGRSGAAILGNAGLEAFVADDAAEFVRKGVSWAGRLTELSAIRAGLRERFANSAAGQPQLIAASLARALRIMWQRWCAGMAAEAFEVTRKEIEDAAELEPHAQTAVHQAVESEPDAEAHNNRGIALQEMGRLDEAEASYRRALQIKPDFVQAHNNLGNTLCALGRLDEAETSYRQALQINPDYAEAHCNLGATLHDLGRLGEAEASYRRVLQIDAGFAEAHYNLANMLRDTGRLDEAEASYRQALQIKPDNAQVHSNLGILLHERGRLDEAEASYRRALQLKPDYAQAHSNLGRTLHDMGRLDEAEASYRRALQFKPDYAEVHNNLGNTLRDLGRLDEAEASYRRALQLKPGYAEAHCNLGSAQHDLGRLEEAEASWRRALQIKPDYAMAYSNLLFCLAQSTAVDAQTLFAEHCRFGDRFEKPFRASPPQHGNSRDPARCLQIGFVSGDLRNHAVSNFIEPMAEQLSGYAQLSLHAYFNHNADDSTSRRIRKYFAYWHQIDSLTDAALAEKIRADGIDILIDLSGHTARNRLLTFARKPAPIQISWMGYPGTTGLRAMDYFLADRFLLPPGRFEDQFTEKIVRLPATTPFLPYKDAPPVSPLPALNNGHITFGSFNRLSKLSREVIALWSQLLRALPDSRLLLGGMPEAGKYDTLLDWFEQEHIARERLDFHPRSDMPGYLRLHQQVDICLDTFPYNGGTTTFHAIWMGVPTLSLSGKTAAGRSGAAILGNAGLEAFVADDAAEFVHKGVSWAGKLTELSAIRAGLRERMANSAAGQPQLIAASLARALRIMWQRWCAGMAADSFEVTRQEVTEVLPGGKK